MGRFTSLVCFILLLLAVAENVQAAARPRRPLGVKSHDPNRLYEDNEPDRMWLKRFHVANVWDDFGEK
ncbi:hypothetical protein FGIG_10182 [Fasciola gigantica]|uniref:Uncharacterized protein n=1 Tax=Fasciola gigantica TaxID=46835 RepID=A0A504YZY7_FASGI|nr:hypothetical protein FGIG_10182 [Fasciola gigantica]